MVMGFFFGTSTFAPNCLSAGLLTAALLSSALAPFKPPIAEEEEEIEVVAADELASLVSLVWLSSASTARAGDGTAAGEGDKSTAAFAAEEAEAEVALW